LYFELKLWRSGDGSDASYCKEQGDED